MTLTYSGAGSFGVGGNNFAAPIGAAGLTRVTWPPVDAGSLPAEGGVEAACECCILLLFGEILW